MPLDDEMITDLQLWRMETPLCGPGRLGVRQLQEERPATICGTLPKRQGRGSAFLVVRL